MKITKTPALPKRPKRQRVAAYARVSRDDANMLHSLAAQVRHYTQFIQSNPEWEFASVYADYAETGTKDNRQEFQRMLTDCRAGKIDIILVKALSRFARNTTTLLEAVRELKALGISVRFEEQNIDTLSADGELMISILAGFAQEESLSTSENIKWRQRRQMAEGSYAPKEVYGYDAVDGKLVINPEQAEVVRRIFSLYLNDGLGQTAICNILNAEGIATPDGGKKWYSSVIHRIIRNPKLCGRLLHQQRYIDSHLTKRPVKNNGELPMYLIENAHEPIISVEDFERVQAEMTRRGKKRNRGGTICQNQE